MYVALPLNPPPVLPRLRTVESRLREGGRRRSQLSAIRPAPFGELNIAAGAFRRVGRSAPTQSDASDPPDEQFLGPAEVARRIVANGLRLSDATRLLKVSKVIPRLDSKHTFGRCVPLINSELIAAIVEGA